MTEYVARHLAASCEVFSETFLLDVWVAWVLENLLYKDFQGMIQQLSFTFHGRSTCSDPRGDFLRCTQFHPQELGLLPFQLQVPGWRGTDVNARS